MSGLFPTNRCFDCLAPIDRDEVLCEHCKAIYEHERLRRLRAS